MINCLDKFQMKDDYRFREPLKPLKPLFEPNKLELKKDILPEPMLRLRNFRQRSYTGMHPDRMDMGNTLMLNVKP